MRGHASVAQPVHVPEIAPSRPRRGAAVVRWVLATGGVAAFVLGLLVWPVGIAALAAPHVAAGFVAIAAIFATAVIAGRAGLGRRTVAWAVGVGVATWALAGAQYVLPGGRWFVVLPHALVGVAAVGWALVVLARTRHEAAAGEVTIQEAAAEFLAKKRIAVTGVSRKPTDHGSNVVYRRLRERGYQVFAVNPNATEVEGDRSYADLKSIPGGVDAVVIATRADRALPTMRECADLGIRHVWMHRSVGAGSVSADAAAWGRQRGIRVIPGGCPLMFHPVSDPGHKVMRSLFTLTGKVPRRV
jgi:predicted CoA-binding protein